MRYLSMIRLDEKRGQAPSEQLMQDLGKLIEEMTRKGQLVSTAGLRPTAEGVRVRLRGGTGTTPLAWHGRVGAAAPGRVTTATPARLDFKRPDDRPR